MPREKDLKRLVRARMQKTGEAYTAARAQIIKKSATKKSSTVAPSARGASTRKIDYAALAGMSDAVVKEKTGCTWKAWVGALDYHGAAEMSHAEIAKLIKTEFEVGSWWTQMVTVGYERIKGLRARGQQRDGTFGATKSRTFNVPVETLFNAWQDASMRAQWLPGQIVRVRTATAPKSMRLDWTDGSIIAVGFVPKGKTKSSVALEHTKLPDRETVTRFKEFWAERLSALNDLLAGG